MAAHGRGSEATVVVDAGGDQGMGELQEDGAPQPRRTMRSALMRREIGDRGRGWRGSGGGHGTACGYLPSSRPLPLELRPLALRRHIQPATPKIARPSAPRRIRLHPLVRCGDSISR